MFLVFLDKSVSLKQVAIEPRSTRRDGKRSNANFSHGPGTAIHMPLGSRLEILTGNLTYGFYQGS
jgi:hypothetical protein